MIRLNDIGHDIIGCAFDVRNYAGRYLRENYYKYALAYELTQRGHKVTVEQMLPVRYKGIEIKDSFRIDILVDDCVVIELKAMNQVGESEFRQILTYLNLSDIRLGYLINFGAEDFTITAKQDKFEVHHGIYRFVNHF